MKSIAPQIAWLIILEASQQALWICLIFTLHLRKLYQLFVTPCQFCVGKSKPVWNVLHALKSYQIQSILLDVISKSVRPHTCTKINSVGSLNICRILLISLSTSDRTGNNIIHLLPSKQPKLKQHVYVCGMFIWVQAFIITFWNLWAFRSSAPNIQPTNCKTS